MSEVIRDVGLCRDNAVLADNNYTLQRVVLHVVCYCSALRPETGWRSRLNLSFGGLAMSMSVWRGLVLALGVAALVITLPRPPLEAQSAPKPAANAATHKVAIQVSQNDKAQMNLALNNARNIIEYFKAKGEPVAIEIVTYGPGLHMLRSDTSPVKDRIAPMALEHSNLKFIACANTQANQSKAEGKQVSLISEATVMPSGVVRLMELQKQGYAYIRP
jgi:hypothetical protein